MVDTKTGGRIVDPSAREVAKKQAEARRETARARKVARTEKRAELRGARRAGKAAASRPAKGISAKYLGKAGGSGRIVRYGLKEGAELIASNCGFDIPSISEGLAPKLRKNIQKQIVRLVFSTPASSGWASAAEWYERVAFIRKKLGVDDSFSYCASRHTDAKHDHIHLDFNRVSDVGELWSDSLIGLRLAVLEKAIEEGFSLKLTRREDFITHGNLNKQGLEREIRLQRKPALLAVQSAIKEAIEDEPDTLAFVARLAGHGITARPNLKDKVLEGFGYQLGRQKFTGEQLGMHWSQLRERVGYVPEEHFERLVRISRETGEGAARPQDTEQGTSPVVGRKDREAQTPPSRARAAESLAGLQDRLDERRIHVFELAKRIRSEHQGDALAERFCEALDSDMTDFEVAESFLSRESGCAEACAYVESYLLLTQDELNAVMKLHDPGVKQVLEQENHMDADSMDTLPPSEIGDDGLPIM